MTDTTGTSATGCTLACDDDCEADCHNLHEVPSHQIAHKCNMAPRTVTTVADVRRCLTEPDIVVEWFGRTAVQAVLTDLDDAHRLIDQLMADRYADDNPKTTAADDAPGLFGNCDNCHTPLSRDRVVVLGFKQKLCPNCAGYGDQQAHRHTLTAGTEISDTRAWLYAVNPSLTMTYTQYPEPVVITVYHDGAPLLRARPGQTLLYRPGQGLTVEADSSAPSDPAWCLYQCPDHHGVAAHTAACPPVDPTRSLCQACIIDVRRALASLDPRPGPA